MIGVASRWNQRLREVGSRHSDKIICMLEFFNEFAPTLDFGRNVMVLLGCRLPLSDDHTVPSRRTMVIDSSTVDGKPFGERNLQLPKSVTSDAWQWTKERSERRSLDGCGKYPGSASGSPARAVLKKSWEVSLSMLGQGCQKRSGPLPLTPVPVCLADVGKSSPPDSSTRQNGFRTIPRSSNSPYNPDDFRGETHFSSDPFLETTSKGPGIVRIKEELQLLPFHGCDLRVPVDGRLTAGTRACEPLSILPGVCVAHTLVFIPETITNEHIREIVVRILNLTPTPQVTQTHAAIMKLANVAKVREVRTEPPNDVREKWKKG